MLQETDSARASKKGDLLLAAGLIALLILGRAAINVSASRPFGGLVQIGVFIVFVLACRQLFRRRLVSYRFTLFAGGPGGEDPEHLGDRAGTRYPLGTFIAEQVTGDKARIIEIIAPADMEALVAPGEGTGLPKRTALLSPGGAQGAHALVYRRAGRPMALRFRPSERMRSALNEIISAVNAAGHGCGGNE